MKLILAFCFQLSTMSLVEQSSSIGSGVYHWNELVVKKVNQRESRSILQGTTNEFQYFEIHATTQYKGAVAKPPHAQDSLEEMIIIKEGIAKCLVGDTVAVLGPGSVLLIPPHEMQQFENIGDGPLTYYVFMFRSKNKNIVNKKTTGRKLLLNYDSLEYKEVNNKGTRKYLDRPTSMTDNFEMHITYLKEKGPSHEPHQHADTEIILMLTGESEMIIDGKNYKAGPGDLYIAESGKMHGIANSTNKPCSYFAFKWR